LSHAQLGECAQKAGFAQLLLRHFVGLVQPPKRVVYFAVAAIELLKRKRAVPPQVVVEVQLLQRLVGVGLEVPERVVEVEKQVAVGLHLWEL
nr:hypothetical protein [Tanacetum cinerariifolium]